MRFDGKVIIVTGAGTGLGLATAQRLASEGARLTLVDRDEKALEGARDAIGGEALLVTADVSAEDQVRAAVERTVGELGRVDGLYNNAGIEGKQDPVEEYDSGQLDKVIDVNLKGVLYGMKHVLPHLKAQGSGAIVNAASVGGIRAVPNLIAYVASKHAVTGMTRQAAVEYGQYGVSVNAVAPGAIMTDMIRGSLIQIAGEERLGAGGRRLRQHEPDAAVRAARRGGHPRDLPALPGGTVHQRRHRPDRRRPVAGVLIRPTG